MARGRDRGWALLEAWVARQHPRNRRGQFRDVTTASLDDLYRAGSVRYGPGEAMALRDYSGDLSQEINRNPKGRSAQALRGLVDRSPLPGRVHVVREVAPHELDGVKAGDVITTNRFMSASAGVSWGFANQFGELHIALPKGAHGAYQPISYGTEDELILPPGTRLRVRRVTRRDGLPVVYAEYTSELREAFAERLHPRDRRGRFARVLTDVGVTPYRGAGHARGQGYYQTARWKGFVSALPRIAERDGVIFGGLEPVRGVWGGGGEPSAQVHVNGRRRSIERFMDDVAGRYDQDAAIAFRRAPGQSVRYVSAQALDSRRVEQALKRTDLPGGTILPDGHLELIDTDDSRFDAVASLAHELSVTFKTEKGYGFLRLAGQHYQKRGHRRAS